MLGIAVWERNTSHVLKENTVVLQILWFETLFTQCQPYYWAKIDCLVDVWILMHPKMDSDERCFYGLVGDYNSFFWAILNY